MNALPSFFDSMHTGVRNSIVFPYLRCFAYRLNTNHGAVHSTHCAGVSQQTKAASQFKNRDRIKPSVRSKRTVNRAPVSRQVVTNREVRGQLSTTIRCGFPPMQVDCSGQRFHRIRPLPGHSKCHGRWQVYGYSNWRVPNF